jgi:hypothetical protein
MPIASFAGRLGAARADKKTKASRSDRSEMLGNVLEPLLARIGEDAEA